MHTFIPSLPLPFPFRELPARYTHPNAAHQFKGGFTAYPHPPTWNLIIPTSRNQALNLGTACFPSIERAVLKTVHRNIGRLPHVADD